jgi:hypothetical protein
MTVVADMAAVTAKGCGAMVKNPLWRARLLLAEFLSIMRAGQAGGQKACP